MFDHFLMFAGFKMFLSQIWKRLVLFYFVVFTLMVYLVDQSLNVDGWILSFSRWYSFLGSEFCPTGFSPNKVLMRPPFLGLRRNEKKIPLLPRKSYKYISIWKLQAAHSRFCFLAFILDCGLLLAPILISYNVSHVWVSGRVTMALYCNSSWCIVSIYH